ncbi:hypothetical protein Mboo_0799 [Methanoregula boonei 6A8]|jgi:hypothetical protein|uniref:Uncharacterized protein n=1 Tax=Methanoregula boonei (strain DSM 21154 / JCM 14090 / 6A8) TaxID=456442 RepID=A7I6F6_METB6|nr:hypothetical protein [Methanoregula boonei]ABS55317.1 hypothetical protein Mboo_0799 [Methanoregula boonei 6A8]
MKPESGDSFSVRLVLVLVCLAVLGSLIAGIDYAQENSAKDNSGISPPTGVAALFSDQCYHTCSTYYQICMRSNPHKSLFREIPCQNEWKTCNASCADSPAQ